MRVDFYVLDDSQPQAGWLMACRLIEKAYQRGHHVFVYCDSEADAMKLDELLWTYKDDSFIPHNLQGEGPEPPPPVQLGYSTEPRGFSDILLNLTPMIPPFHTRFHRLIELVLNDDAAKEISREHYRAYRHLGYEQHIHPIQK